MAIVAWCYPLPAGPVAANRSAHHGVRQQFICFDYSSQNGQPFIKILP